jgi:hypothetical protein
MGLSLITGGWITTLVGAIISFSGVVVSNWDKIKETFVNTFNNIKEFFGQVMGGLKQGFTNLVTNAKTTFNGWIEGLKVAWTNLCTLLKTKMSSAWNSIISIFSKDGGGGFKAITDGISTVLKTYVNKLINGINSVIAKPFSAIQSMMNKLRNWKIAGMQPFRNLPYMSIPKIPTLSTGGFPEDGLFFANSSELVGKFNNGNTAVVNNEQILRGIEEAVRNGFAPYLSGMNNSAPDVVVNLDSYELARVITRKQRYLERVEGRSF